MIREVQQRDRLEPIGLHKKLRVPKTAHLKQLTLVGCLNTRLVVLRCQDRLHTIVLLHEPNEAVALAFACLGVVSHLGRLDLTKTLIH